MTAPNSNLATSPIERGCQAATRRLRWEYTAAYRRRHRLPGVQPNQHEADQAACLHLRHILPIVLATHLPGVELNEWDDPNPTVIDSTWHHTGWLIDVHWDYHPDWVIGDPTGIVVHPIHPDHNREQVA